MNQSLTENGQEIAWQALPLFLITFIELVGDAGRVGIE